ncbi:tumor necrosis factor alpha-induced protein 2-like isoform X1 [Xiphophorus hellerii]|uniref:tumor necrosis factor alpha-induced protein 2-like isoform X1 n=1 Tax=Xiphophorus hellerii TaxID=8084 RepID=UPI0013B3BD28|nr:tumor necrosis factor alpha-induced protein 2-like isoform X1 [Xiphophorus hellerii]XP_032440804.1 tumor necrosis factor alpha-induced protein 2-like isoform X1 [Xiphophorus hellerii]
MVLVSDAWNLLCVCMVNKQAGGADENPGGTRKRIPKLKIPANIWSHRKQKNQQRDDQPDGGHEEEEEEQQEEERLDDLTRKLILREEELFTQDCRSEEEEDQLLKDFESLSVRVWMAVHSSFDATAPPAGRPNVLRSAVDAVLQQETQDRRWTESPADSAPVWRPLRWLRTHNQLLQKMVEKRLKDAGEDETGDTGQLSSITKRQVFRLGKRVKEDLLMAAVAVRDCYPPRMDILNIYGGLYHQAFAAHLAQLSSSELDLDDCSYLLFWVNHYYPDEILQHKELDGIKTACLGSLLLLDTLRRLEEQFMSHRQEKVKLWLSTALKKEEESWLSGKTPELIDCYYFSPLAIDVIQVVNSSLTEFSCAIKDQNKVQRLTIHLENFLSSYRKSVEDLVKANPSNLHPVLKATLVCEQQLRDYISGQAEGLAEDQKRRCLDTLSALRDCCYQYFIFPLHGKIKVFLSPLWTSAWVDGSLPVIDQLLSFLNQQLADLSDLKPACKQPLVCDLHQDLAAQYVKKTMKTRVKNRQQQVAGSERMVEDVKKMDGFFREEGCSSAPWLSETLCSVAEILRLQDPASVHLEVVDLARRFPDFSGAHVSALLSLKFGLSAADVRSIRTSVEENRPLDASANQSPPFFSSVKVKWINNKINQMAIKS